MNRIKDLVIQFCKFGAVGGLCFGIDYGLMIFLTETHIMHYLHPVPCRLPYPLL